MVRAGAKPVRAKRGLAAAVAAAMRPAGASGFAFAESFNNKQKSVKAICLTANSKANSLFADTEAAEHVVNHSFCCLFARKLKQSVCGFVDIDGNCIQG